MATGTVKWFSTFESKGLIITDSHPAGVAVNGITLRTCGLGSLTQGQKISFNIIDDRGKPRAVNIKRI